MVTNAVTPVTPAAVTGNNDGKRIRKKFKTGIDFEINENFIYYLDEKKRRLCLPSSMGKNVFRLTHDENMHAGIYRCFNRLIKENYFPRLSKKKELGVILNIILVASSFKQKNTDHMAN